jgi:DNA-directed RNA polymerase specialized sigma24 family protein
MTWLTRAATDAATRGEEPRNRFARWTARWFAPTPTVAASRFQNEGEPYPRHWRRFPAAWPTADAANAALQELLADALDELPATWREVVIARDGFGRDAADVSARLGLTPRQQRAILTRARAQLRERIAQRFVQNG